uniref:TIR domain-containing protein n=1 Tax=Zooxanthella nutricula TaxID=1333877 RepID=A0A6U9URZ9_9DINO|mmetsp:Transcript_43045/g.130021  ORF Transcript_43045/g.130021 Transcript_43045/m.130021 type:complete len:1648 (+) Transcript_43045:51-4994(+)|eukprot:CAMPEP_0198586610 /NCGR_PEP_ID=MMETSP1462-20131121/130817_1 /TAXON_ID=1333877 /ORGANISM="Brandtodinium nutriculum, Strain RCC3387" /LENGTH=1647 /DNA_ID=CAMNT_0044318067 /DNA_START=1 /DNA_END=4944 /DNA_ORIENTATION=+
MKGRGAAAGMAVVAALSHWASLGQASLLTLPVKHCVSNTPMELEIHGSPGFFASQTKAITLECIGAAGNSTADCPKTQDAVACNVTCASAGWMPCSVGWRAPAGGVGELIESFMLGVYDQPNVQAVTSTLPLSGGRKFEMTLADWRPRVEYPRFGAVKVRLRHAFGDVYDFDLALDLNLTRAMGRSPTFNPTAAAGDSLSVELAMNGVQYLPTGFTALLETVAPLKVGFIYVGAPSDFGWNFQHNVARLNLERMFFGQIETRAMMHVEEFGPNRCTFCHEEQGWNNDTELWSGEPGYVRLSHDSAVVMEKWVQEGVKLIITTSYYYHWDTYYMAGRHPNNVFMHVSGWLTRPNMAQAFPKIFQARYLSGIAMGWYIKKHNLTKRVGYLSAFPLGETVRAINALKRGLEEVDPDIEIYLTWMFTWHDDRKELLTARRLIHYYGAEGIAQHTDSRSPQLVARDMNKMGTGYNTDMLLTVGDSVLTSPVMEWTTDYADVVQKVIDGETDVEANFRSGFDRGSFRLSELSPRVPSEARIHIAREMEKFQRGEDTIFCKEYLIDNKGNVRNNQTNPMTQDGAHVPGAGHLIPGTSCLAPGVVDQMCQTYVGYDCQEHWLLKGVHDTCEPGYGRPERIRGVGLDDSTCYLGGLSLVDMCPDGQILEISGCVNVSRGMYARSEVSHSCDEGFFAPVEGLSSCAACPIGRVSGSQGAHACDLCAPGTFAARAGSSECRVCPPGTFANETGAAKCTFCPQGTIAEQHGSSYCTPCGPGLTTSVFGASTAACRCAAGSYHPANSTEGPCEACPDGMICEFASSVDNLQAWLEGGSPLQTGSPFPVAADGHMSLRSEPMKVYKCYDKRNCPGGVPGSCASLRDTAAVACGVCADNAFDQDGECFECRGLDVLPFVLAVLGAIGVCVAMTVIVNKDLLRQTKATMAVAIMLAITFTSIQTINVFDSLAMSWFEPIRSIMNALALVSFDISVLRLGCLGFLSSSGAASFAMRQCIAPLGIPFVLVTLLVKRWRNPETQLFVELANTVGTLYQIFFMSIVDSALKPFMCYAHPNGNGESMLEMPSILCFEGGEHTSLMIIGFFGMAFVPIPYVAMCVYAIWKYPRFIAGDVSSTSWLKFESFRFMFFRFSPERYYYSLILVTRSLCLCFVPVVFRHDGSLQIFAISVTLGSFEVVQAILTPWRTYWVNIMDACLTAMLQCFLLLGAMVTKAEISEATVGTLGQVAVSLFLLGILVAVCVAIVMRFFPQPFYHYFICHHKAHSAAQARLLKLLIVGKTKKKVFIDSDDLVDLDTLFDTVKSKVGTLLVYLTRDTLTRPWCAGEVFMAIHCKVKVTAIRTSGFEEPSEKQLSNLEEYIDLTSCNLARFSIELPKVADAFRLLIDKGVTDTETIPVGYSIEASLPEVVQWLVSSKQASQHAMSTTFKQDSLPAKGLLISVDPRDDEACAAAAVLRHYMMPSLVGFMSASDVAILSRDVADWTQLVQASTTARAVVAVCSAGTMSCDEQLLVIVEAVGASTEEESSNAPKDPLSAGKKVDGPACIPLSLPSFTFPNAEYFEAFREKALFHDPDYAVANIKKLFMSICVYFPVHAADRVLVTQATAVVSRVPAKDTDSHRPVGATSSVDSRRAEWIDEAVMDDCTV